MKSYGGPAEDVPMLRERVRLLAEQSAGAAASTFLGALLIGVVLASGPSRWHAVLWIAAYIGPAFLRVTFSRRVLADKVPADAAALRRYLGFALFNGVWTGALPVAFFSGLSAEGRAALTVVSLLALTAGAATFASYRTGYLYVLALALPPLIAYWAQLGGSHAWIVVVTLLVFGALMVRLSGHLAEVFERSVLIRFERERVVEQLRREKEETERAREKAEEASRSKSRFLASASHDLRQPVHALGLFSSVLDASAETPQLRTLAQHIASVSDILKKLLDNLLDISRLDAGVVSVSVQPVSLQALVDGLATEAGRLVSGRPVEIVAQAEDLRVVLDPVHVERCLRNLLDNACKFTQRGRIALHAAREGEDLVFRVSDTGIGIPPDQLDLVFEEFYQVGNKARDQAQGLGLGLSIVARLAALMQGEVRVESLAGHGSTFQLRIPYVAAQRAVPRAQERGGGAPDLHDRRILIVDDEALVRASMRELLTAWGAEVDEADGWRQASAIGEDQAQAWDLCLCDLRLRDGEDGLDTAQRLRVLQPELPVVLITGDTAPARIEQAARTRLPLLHKPVGPAELGKAIRSALAAG
ncbi:response regulator [Ramlibacter sp. USB13]|uniref:histidine kinase n=1 Tax=Ramlibacter cellulosilyticus TaxID=2764187 RepID=A0A923MUI9_9BURK|nr:ATP-binding protein [Ramlibacter cellulosilyticus]MBC5785251.1 response regulator [Ramlibacter cellulosilyticus]